MIPREEPVVEEKEDVKPNPKPKMKKPSTTRYKSKATKRASFIIPKDKRKENLQPISTRKVKRRKSMGGKGPKTPTKFKKQSKKEKEIGSAKFHPKSYRRTKTY